MTHRIGLSITLIAAALILASCASRPYPVAAERTLAVPEKGTRAFGLCYNALVSDEAEILAEARLLCASGELVRAEDDTLWTPCGLWQLTRANFLCRSAPAEQPQP